MIQKNAIYTFSSFPQTVITAISTRYFGSIKDRYGFYPENIEAFCHALGISPNTLVFPQQKHTANVKVVLKDNLKRIIPDELGIDGLITQEKGIFLGVVTADCLPVLFCDPKNNIVGVVHAGYKGVLAGILEHTLEAFVNLGSEKNTIRIGIGPAIGVCCYTVSQERANLFFEKYPKCKDICQKRKDELFLDLAAIAEYALVQQGLKRRHIEKTDICTKHSRTTFYSKRGDSEEFFGEFASIIGMNV